MMETRPHSFVIWHLVTNQTFEVHGSRLKFYSDSSLDVNEKMLAQVGNQGMLLGVESIKEHRKARGGWQLLVSCVGLQDEDDSWEPLTAIDDQVPTKVAHYTSRIADEVFPLPTTTYSM